MIEIVNKLSLVGDKFIPEIHLRQPEFIYSACGSFTKNEEHKNLKKREIHNIFTKTN